MVEFPGTEADQPLKPPPEPSPGQSVQHQFGGLVCMASKSSQMWSSKFAFEGPHSLKLIATASNRPGKRRVVSCTYYNIRANDVKYNGINPNIIHKIKRERGEAASAGTNSSTDILSAASWGWRRWWVANNKPFKFSCQAAGWADKCVIRDVSP